jgi:prepilin-type N-terminal cleavage/methylation domain-containing protein
MRPRSIIDEGGFTLLECLVSLFILALLITTVLRHQVFLLETQAQITERRTVELLVHDGNVLMNFPHPSDWWQSWEHRVLALPEGRYYLSSERPHRLTVCTKTGCMSS